MKNYLIFFSRTPNTKICTSDIKQKKFYEKKRLQCFCDKVCSVNVNVKSID